MRVHWASPNEAQLLVAATPAEEAGAAHAALPPTVAAQAAEWAGKGVSFFEGDFSVLHGEVLVGRMQLTAQDSAVIGRQQRAISEVARVGCGLYLLSKCGAPDCRNAHVVAGLT